jgi:hypothetical protein
MKNVTALLIFVLSLTGILNAQDSKYVDAMKKNIAMMDSLRTVESINDLTNSFLRVANAEKNKWLPYYYASYLYVIASYSDTVRAKKDTYLDEADKAIKMADSLMPNESEINTIEGMICQARMQVDPMNRYMTYGEKMNEYFRKAAAIDKTNPRPEYLTGMTTFYMPQEFGGGAEAAKPIFESALKKFNEFVPKNELMPHWGKGQLEAFLKQNNLLQK